MHQNRFQILFKQTIILAYLSYIHVYNVSNLYQNSILHAQFSTCSSYSWHLIYVKYFQQSAMTHFLSLFSYFWRCTKSCKPVPYISNSLYSYQHFLDSLAGWIFPSVDWILKSPMLQHQILHVFINTKIQTLHSCHNSNVVKVILLFIKKYSILVSYYVSNKPIMVNSLQVKFLLCGLNCKISHGFNSNSCISFQYYPDSYFCYTSTPI